MSKAKLFFCILALAFLAFGAFTARGEWLQYQFSQNSSGFFPTNNSFNAASIINLTSPESGSNLQPLVGDLNGDDVNEIVAFGANSILVYNPYLNLKTQYNAGGNIIGQPTLFNVSGDKGMELILSLNVTDVHYFMAYNYSSTFAPISNISITNNLSGSGIKCTGLNNIKSCIFMDNSFFIHVVNLSSPNNPVDNATQVSNSPNRANTTNYETIPAIADFDNDGNKEALFWNDNDAGNGFGFVVFDLVSKIKDATPSSGSNLIYSSNQKAGQPIFVKSNFSLTYIAFASNTGTTGQIRNFNGTGTNLLPKWSRNLDITGDLALASGSLLAVDCDSNGFEDIAGMAEGSTFTRSRLFCFNGDNTQLYMIDNIDFSNIIEKTATAVNISGNSTPEVVTYKGIYSFDGTLVYGFSGLGTQAPIPIDVNKDEKLDFLWADATNGVKLFISNESSAPIFSNLMKSPEPSFKNQITYINVTWQDSAGIDAVLIAHNGTENWANYAVDNSFGNNVYNLTIPASYSNYSLKVIGWYSTANDTAGNRNTTDIQTFVVSNRAPTVTSATISNTDELNRTNGSLTASWTFTDSDNDVMLGNETLWHINGTENEAFRNLTSINSTNTAKNQNWSFSVRVFDGTNFSAFFSSANITIANALQSFNHSLGVESIERNTLFTYDVNYTDLDNDNITFSDNSTLFNITNEGIINFTPALSGNITVNITLSQNPNVTGILTIEVSDSLAPIVTAISASSSGTSTVTVTLSATTDETAQCRFATSDLNFTGMAAMSSTNSLSHSNSQSFTSDTSGTYYVRCNDTIGNVMNVSNSTAFNADIQESSSGGGDGGGGGGGGGGWQCRYKVQCTGWSECADGEQTRECSNVEVIPFYSPTKCEYLLEQETERECNIEVEEAKEELEVPEPAEEEITDTDESESVGPTGAAIFAGLMGNLKPWHGLIALGIIAAIGIGSYAYFRRPSSELTEEEMERLHKMMEREYLKSKEEQERVN